MYAPLKVTTDYSMLKSLIKISDLISFLNENKINACAIVDDNLYGVLEFYEICKKNNIKPIIGLEIKLEDLKVYLYAMNYNGYKNLLKIHTLKERQDLDIKSLQEYSNDILIIIPFISHSLYEKLSFFKYRYISYSNIEELKDSQSITDNILYLNDIRALEKKDIIYLQYLDMLRKENKSIYIDNYYKKDISFLGKLEEVVNILNVEMPMYKSYVPKYNKDIDSFTFLKTLASKGLLKRLNNKITDAYKNRLDYELSVINKMGFVDYFLIVYDYVLYAKKNNILVGPGRGSSAGSLVSYAIGITEIDPIKYHLMFERFLNPERITMPDIDIDFDALKRDQVINYVKSKYGPNNVALGITFNNLKSKLVLREVGKLLNIDNNLMNHFIKYIDASKSLLENFDNVKIKQYLNTYKELKQVYDISFHLEGLKKNTSTHASGVVISCQALDEIIPIHYENNNLHTGIEMKYLENLGLLKMDFLGVKNITTIAKIMDKCGLKTLRNINLEDKNVYQIFTPSKVQGIFQFDTDSMKSLLAKLEPNTFEDLIAGVALGRPGPRMHLNSYVERKKDKSKITYIHNDLKSILEPTYGILIYQEQILEILVKIAGYTLSEADIVRRAISKKNKDVLKQEFVKFVKSSIKRGYKKEDAIKIYNEIAPFASYGFNKSHSVAYALVSYQMAYLKCYYPEYFYLEYLNDGASDITQYIRELKRIGIVIRKPSININSLEYDIMNKVLLMPITIIKNITRELAIKILSVQGSGFSDIFDFALKTKEFMTEDILTRLIHAGVFDDFNINHQTLIENIPSIINYAEVSDGDTLISKPYIVEYDEYDKSILREEELNSYGFYITNHPASIYTSKDYVKLVNIEDYLFKKIKCAVIIDSVKSIKTKKEEDMAFLTASDETEVREFTVFPNTYNKLSNINNLDLVEITGEVTKRFDKISIIVNNIRKIN